MLFFNFYDQQVAVCSFQLLLDQNFVKELLVRNNKVLLNIFRIAEQIIVFCKSGFLFLFMKVIHKTISFSLYSVLRIPNDFGVIGLHSTDLISSKYSPNAVHLRPSRHIRSYSSLMKINSY